jgi:glycosyltransferase involved in cell wall biosynthesis
VSTIRVLFAPDYRAGTPYQALLAEALSVHGVGVTFLSNYRRGLPLFRGSREMTPDIVHLHWPEQYFRRQVDIWDRLRVMRYPLDCWLTANSAPIVLTAHNLLPHNRTNETGVLRNIRSTAQQSKGIFVHSDAARQKMIDAFSVNEERVHVIPFGDHAVSLGKPLPREIARAALRLPINTKVCLMFGTVSPYKGSDEVVRLWADTRLPYRLAVVGPILSDAYAERLAMLAEGCPMIDLRLTRQWLDDATLRLWLSASDCVVFNYREIFASGAAALARAFGVPVLIPNRLTFIDLHEPHPHVFRFHALDDDFGAQLKRALTTPSDYALAYDWRQASSWDYVAEITASTYRSIKEQVEVADHS